MKTILMIDDEMYLREFLARMLEHHGYRVLSASTGEDGITQYQQNRPDHVFLDVMLPGIDGEEVFRQIKSIDAHASIFFITGSEMMFSRENALQMGARGYLAKPIMPAQLLALLRDIDKEPAGAPAP